MRHGARKSLEEALRSSVDALGGAQVVGHLLKPEFSPERAGQWLNHCLLAGRRDRLSLLQVMLIFRKAYEAGKHEGFEALARMLGYQVVAIDARTEIEQITRRAEAAAAEALSLSQEALARMRAANLRID